MSLADVITYANGKEKTLVVFSPTDSTLVADLRDYFSTQNVAIDGAQTRSGEPANVAVLRHNGEVLASVPAAQLQELLAGGGLPVSLRSSSISRRQPSPPQRTPRW